MIRTNYLNIRLLSYNSQTREVKVLLDNLHFPNGVQVSPDGTFVIVAELTRCRLIKWQIRATKKASWLIFSPFRYYLAGEKRGRSEILSENLPGSPDNVRLSSDGHIWVAFGFVRSGRRFSAFDAIGPHPWLRSLITKVFQLALLLLLLSLCHS